jgi:hypothetical protein
MRRRLRLGLASRVGVVCPRATLAEKAQHAFVAGAGALKRFQAKWTPVRVKKTRQIKNLEPRFDSIETEKAPGCDSINSGRSADVRFVARNGLKSDIAPYPKSANSGLNRKMASAYSITRSARERNTGENVNPIVFAVRKLTASSNVVGCSTGMSAGFVPLRTLSTRSAARRYLSGRRSP